MMEKNSMTKVPKTLVSSVLSCISLKVICSTQILSTSLIFYLGTSIKLAEITSGYLGCTPVPLSWEPDPTSSYSSRILRALLLTSQRALKFFKVTRYLKTKMISLD
jgi:hypothetical protein